MEEEEHVDELRKGREHATAGFGAWKSRIDSAQQLQDGDTGGALGLPLEGGKGVGKGGGGVEVGHEHEERDVT
jgi:hypothetical protein